MVTYKELIDLDFSESVISTYLRRGSLIIDKSTSSYNINSERLLSNIMKRSLMNNLELAERLFNYASLEDKFYYYVVTLQKDSAYEIFKRIPEKSKLVRTLGHYIFNEKIRIDEINIGIKDGIVNDLLYLLKKYIYLREPSMVLYIMEEILKRTSNDFELFIIKVSSDMVPLSAKYVYDETDFSANKVCYDYLTNLEKRLLFLIEWGDYKSALRTLSILGDIYSMPGSLSVVYLLIMNLNILNDCHNVISSRDLNTVVGQEHSVLLELLNNKDFYRSSEVINEMRLSETNFSYILEIYHLLIERILGINNKNLEHVARDIQKKFDGTEEDIKQFGKYRFPSISLEMIETSLKLSDAEIDKDVNYYELYLNDYRDKNYASAKRNLIKHFTKLKRNERIIKVDYLLKELDFLIANERHSEDTKEKIQKMRDKSKKAEDNGNFLRAIYYLQECIKWQQPINSFDLAHIGVLYYQLNNYEEAVNYLEQASDLAIKPDDFVIYLLSLLKMNMYDETINESEKYFAYYLDDNNVVHYIRSICYLHLAEYEDALYEIDSIEIINAAYHNNMGVLAYEKNIIEDNMDGGSSTYSFDDYFEFGLMECERPLYKRIGRMIEEAKTAENIQLRFIEEAEVIVDVNRRVEYLLSVLKILLLHRAESEAIKLLDYINNAIKENDLIGDKEKLLRITTVYNSNFLDIE